MTGEHERLPRLLSLVPYLQAHPGVAIATAAADFGVSGSSCVATCNCYGCAGCPDTGPEIYRPVVRG